ncbi:MAG: NmrA family NAD(P)-binding protein [Candidatus Heimdallarchaeota archaeon]|nr:MAG: NmrA family NAD(P)-binding protein [Candidatus Heimdallarchaeota archaeon]
MVEKLSLGIDGTMSNTEKILVLGGTGHYGRHIVKALIENKQKVRVLSRNMTKAREIIGEEPEILEGDITSNETVINALQGVSAIIICVSAFNKKNIRKFKLIERDSVLIVLYEAEKIGIKRIVYISVYGKPDVNVDISQGRIKREIEDKLEQTSFNYTILGAPPSMEIFFSMIRKGKMTVPGGGPPALPTIAPIDLGKIAAQTVVRSDLNRKRFSLVGSDVISFREAADRISKVTGKEIGFRKVPLFPIKVAALITGVLRPFFPYISQLLKFIILMNTAFTSEMVEQAFDHQRLLQETFDYQPLTLEEFTMKYYNLK